MNARPHSTGPWRMGSNGASVKVVDAEDKAVCMLTYRRDGFNGDLISAAPELLEALTALHELVTRTEYAFDPANIAARAAIAKATGEVAA